MNHLTPHECRVLGVLIEKAQTTPGQYPLTLNALVTGCNQKSNRDPVVQLDEDHVIEAVDGLKQKQLAREVMLTGSRVQKYRHIARETLEISTAELVVLAELLLRGPQTLGELRGRASRMHQLDSLELVTNVLDQLRQRELPLATEVPPAPGSRAKRYAQLLCPDLHPLDAVERMAAPPENDQDRLADLDARLDEVTAAVRKLAALVGAPDPFEPA